MSAPRLHESSEFDEIARKTLEGLEAAGNPEGITEDQVRERLAEAFAKHGGKTFEGEPGLVLDDEDMRVFDAPAQVRELRIPAPTEAYWYTDPEQGATIRHFILMRRALGAVFHGGLMLQGPAGCLAADTIINLNRGGKGYSETIERVVKRSSGASGRYQWDRAIETKVARADGAVVKLGTMASAWFSGHKQTYTLKTETSRTIRATATHPFLTPDGWRQLGDLQPGMAVQVNVERSQPRERKAKTRYLMLATRFHPNQASRGKRGRSARFTVPVHRMTVEADMNGLSLDEFHAAVLNDPVRSGSLVFLDPNIQVHHRDHDSLNNARSNLSVMTRSQHRRHHGLNGDGDSVLWQIGTETIESIEVFGVEPTYDLELTDDPHNFLANGFVVHNSGKTLGMSHLIAQMNAELGLDLRLFRMNCAVQTDPQKWFGRREINKAGSRYEKSDFILAVERGDVIQLDEANRIHPHIANSIHSLLDGTQELALPDLNLTIEVNPATVFVATMNIGSQYGGTHRLDQAFRSRFSTTIEVGPPPRDEEIKVVSLNTGCDSDAAATLVDIAIKSRDLFETGDLRTEISTRDLVAAGRWVAAGKTIKQALELTVIPAFDGDANGGSVGAESDRTKIRSLVAGKLGR